MSYLSCSETARPCSHRPILLLLVCLISLWLGSRGLYWPTLHPDEHPIAEWIDQTQDQWSLTARVYAGGFFVLTRPIQLAVRAANHFLNAQAYRLGKTNQPTDQFNTIIFARWVNVWLTILSGILIYGLTRRVTCSGGAGILAAALFLFSQYIVEHSHYAETDMAMMFMLCLTLWLWSNGIHGKHLLWFFAAALAGGFAAGTKFHLTLLVVVPPILALTGMGLPEHYNLKKRWLLAGLGVLLFICGLLLANPRMLIDWNGFHAGLLYESQRLKGETAMNMGQLRDRVDVRYIHHLLMLKQYTASLGWGWLLAALLGIPLACRQSYRKHLPILFVFPLLFLGYWIFGAPWVRSQEFMVFMPTLAVLAVLPVLTLWRMRKIVIRGAAVILAIAALMPNAANGFRVAALFGWNDTRFLARQWLAQHLPETTSIAAEPYAEQACPQLRYPPHALGGKVESPNSAFAEGESFDYVIRSISHTGRGLRDPRNEQLYPEIQQRFDSFCEQYERLAVFGACSQATLATFASPTLELWKSRSAMSTIPINLELSQPLWIHDVYGLNKNSRPTVFPAAHKIGGALGLLVDSRPRELAIGAPGKTNLHMYLLLNTEEREAEVRIRDGIWCRTVRLAPYSSEIVPLNHWRWPPDQPFERITLAATPRKNVLYLPCYARIIFGTAEAARICSDLDMTETFWKVFKDDVLEHTSDPMQIYMLAVRSEKWELAERFEQAALQAASGLTQSLFAKPADISVHGINGQTYNELAQTRLQPYNALYDDHCDNNWGEQLLSLNLANADTQKDAMWANDMELPIRLANGIYELSGELLIKTEANMKQASTSAKVEIAVNPCQTWIECPTTKYPSKSIPFNIHFTVEKEQTVQLFARSQSPVRLSFHNLVVHWSLSSELNTLHRAFQTARAAHALQRGQPAEALSLLESLDKDANLPYALEIRQLMFQSRLAMDPTQSPQLTHAAKSVLALAPADFACLRTLAESNPALLARVQRLSATLEQPVAFGPFLSLLRCDLDPSQHKLTLVLEATRNHTPPLAVTLYAKRHGRWRHRQTVPLGVQPYLHQGERVAGDIILNDKFGQAPSADDIALGIESDVTWHPGKLSIAGQRQGVLPLTDIHP